MYTVDSGPSLLASQERKSIRKTERDFGNPNREPYHPFHKREEGLHSGARYLPLREVGGKFAFSIVVGTILR